MKIHEFLASPERRSFTPTPEADALRDDGALAEAALLDIRFDAVRSELQLLVDCRGALQLEAGNTAVLVLKQVKIFQWEAEVVIPRVWRTVIGSQARPQGPGAFELTAFFVDPGESMRVVCAAGEFFIGDVPGCDEPPPNFLTASDNEVRAQLQGWNSEFSPVHASFLD